MSKEITISTGPPGGGRTAAVEAPPFLDGLGRLPVGNYLCSLNGNTVTRAYFIYSNHEVYT